VPLSHGGIQERKKIERERRKKIENKREKQKEK
jgi:hypothetical protein